MEVIMPQMGESVAEGTIIKWIVKVGDEVAVDDPLFEISTDKVDAEIPSPAAGVITEIIVPEGETIEVGKVVAMIGDAGSKPAAPVAAASKPAPAVTGKTEPSPPPSPPTPAPAPAPPSAAAPADIRSSPIARRIAREQGVDIGAIPGTGRKGRVSKNDVLAFVERGGPVAAAPPAGGTPPPSMSAPAPVAFPSGADSVSEPMSIMRKKIAEHMVASKRTAPHVLTVFDVDVSRAQKIRAARKAEFETRHGARLTLTTMVLHSVIPAILRFPVLNSSVDGDSIVYHKSVHFGIAVALDDGLIVPVIRNAERLGLGDLARHLQDLGGRAREKKLVPDEVQGATFTITNPGPFGALFNFPVINQPNVAILGMGGAKKTPVVIGDAVGIRDICHFSLSFDHRAIDGAVADQFMAYFKERLENFPEEVVL